MLTFKDVACKRGGRVIFSKLDLFLSKGELICLRGANGSGKTSLLKIAAGLLIPSQGSVTQNSPEPILYLGHRPGVQKHLTVYENLAFYAKLYNNELLFDVAIHYFGLGEILDMPCAKLSAGWQQRVGLSRLVLAPTSLWLLDEPFTHLDTEGKELLQNLLQAREGQGGATMLSTHQDLPFGKEIQMEKYA